MTQYAVVGDPVAHSKSPQIHRLFAEQTGEDVQYEKHRVGEDEFPRFVTDFFAAGGGGLNITLPHKEAAFSLAQHRSQQARLAKAANTLWMSEADELQADNTDGTGLVNDLRNNHLFELEGKNILMLGAGGAARGALAALIQVKAARITLLNRTFSRAQALQDDFSDSCKLDIGDYHTALDQQFDLIVNATAMSLEGEAPPLSTDCLAPGCCCYDMMYGDEDTAFMKWAKESNNAALILDGFGMLVEQAAESFYLWRGVRPDSAAVIAALRR